MAGSLALGRTQLLVIGLSLAFVVLLAGWFFVHPTVYHHWCVDEYIPSAQRRFGFEAARVSVAAWGSRSVLAVVRVEPGGALARAGFRPGDIPVDHHGGESAFCGALQGAERGGYSNVAVVNLADLAARGITRRELEIPKPQR